MSAAPGAFSARNSHIPRSRTPPTTTGFRRTLSNASSRSSAVQSSSAAALGDYKSRGAALPKSSTVTTANNNSRRPSLSTAGELHQQPGDDQRSVTSVATTRVSTPQKSNSHPYSGHYGGVPAYKNKNMAPRVYLPGEEEVVMNSKVVDVALAAADIDLLENDLGRSSLMMPKAVRQKMLTMRHDLFPETEALLRGSGINPEALSSAAAAGGGEKDEKEKKDAFFGAGSAGVSAGAPPVGPDAPPPLPRGSQLLRRLQSSADRSARLLEELDKRGNSCGAMLDSLLLGGVSKPKKHQHHQHHHSPPSSTRRRDSVIGTPSPDSRQQRRDEHGPKNLDDTFAGISPTKNYHHNHGGATDPSPTATRQHLSDLDLSDSPPSASPPRRGGGCGDTGHGVAGDNSPSNLL